MKLNIKLIFLFSIYFLPFIAWVIKFLFNSNYEYFYLLFSMIVIMKIIVEGEKLFFPKYLKFFFLFLLYSILNDIIILNILDTMSIAKYIANNIFLIAFLVFIIVENTLIPPKFLKISNTLLFSIIILSFIVSVVQMFNPSFFVQIDQSEKYLNMILYERGSSLSIYSWLGRNSLGISFIAISCVYTGQLLLNKKNTTLILILSGTISFLSKGRYVMVSFLYNLFQRYFYGKRDFIKITKTIFYILTIVLLTLGFLQYVLKVNVNNIIEERILETNKPTLYEKGASSRLIAFEVFSEIFPINPFFGAGMKNTAKLDEILEGRSSTIHVGWLYIFYTYGIFGGFLFIIFFFHLLKNLTMVARISGFWGSHSAFITFALANLTLPYFKLFEMGLVIALIYNKIYKQNIISQKRN